MYKNPQYVAKKPISSKERVNTEINKSTNNKKAKIIKESKATKNNNNEKIKKNKIEKKKFFSPVMKRNKQFKIRNKLREKYLFNCISISKFKNISPNP